MGGVAVTQVRFMSVEGEERIVARTGFVRRLLWVAELKQLINTLWRERPASRRGGKVGHHGGMERVESVISVITPYSSVLFPC
jgi:hypothetical protein